MISPIMTFELSEVDLDKDWDELFACEWTAWMNPPQSLWELTFPNLGTSPSDEAEAIKKGAARQLQGIRADPRSQWMKMVDTATGKIVAGALWKFYESNQYRAPMEESSAAWLPEGELRDLCDSMYAQNRSWKPRIMPVAHGRQYFEITIRTKRDADPLDLINLFTHPEFRSQGLGGRLVEWGIQEADRRGYEAYVEGTFLGRKVYERYGFVVMHIAEMRFENQSPGEEWVRLVKELKENPIAIMWRSAGGKHVKGETVVPWEGAPRKE